MRIQIQETENMWDLIELYGTEGCIVEGEGIETVADYECREWEDYYTGEMVDEITKYEDYMLRTKTGKLVYGYRQRPTSTINQYNTGDNEPIIEDQGAHAPGPLMGELAPNPEDTPEGHLNYGLLDNITWNYKEERINRCSRILEFINNPKTSNRALRMCWGKLWKCYYSSRERCFSRNDWSMVFLTKDQIGQIVAAFATRGITPKQK